MSNRLLSVSDLVVILIVSVAALVVVNIDLIIRLVFSQGQSSADYFYHQVGEMTDVVLRFLSDTLLSPDIASFILWGVIGLICYYAVEYLFERANDFNEAREVDTKYMHPKSYKSKIFWKEFLIRFVVTFVIVLVLFIWMVLIFRFFLAMSSAYFELALFGGEGLLASMFYIFFSTLIIMVSFTGLVVLKRVAGVFRLSVYE